MRGFDRAQESYGHKPGDATRYLPLVRTLADRLRYRLPEHIERDDLIGAGVVGLMEAMGRFDPEQADKFEGFLACRIRGAMLDELRRRDLMARDARSESKRIEATLARLTRQLGRAPEEEEVARDLKIEVSVLRGRLSRLAPVRVGTFDQAMASDEFGPLDHTLAAERQHLLAVAIKTLPLRSQNILHLYYREELTLKDIGAVISVTESRVSQILTSIILQLRVQLRIESDL